MSVNMYSIVPPRAIRIALRETDVTRTTASATPGSLDGIPPAMPKKRRNDARVRGDESNPHNAQLLHFRAQFDGVVVRHDQTNDHPKPQHQKLSPQRLVKRQPCRWYNKQKVHACIQRRIGTAIWPRPRSRPNLHRAAEIRIDENGTSEHEQPQHRQKRPPQGKTPTSFCRRTSPKGHTDRLRSPQSPNHRHPSTCTPSYHPVPSGSRFAKLMCLAPRPQRHQGAASTKSLPSFRASRAGERSTPPSKTT